MMSGDEINALDADTFSDVIFERVRTSPATLSEAEMRELEEAVRADHFGYARRGALGVLTQTGAEIINAVAEDRPTAVAFADLLNRITAYRNALTDLLDLLRQAEARLLVALANRDDMQEVMAEAGNGARKEPGSELN
jgi:hypothetical protein